ncbi:SbcC/MukB-like Walker B domain-containing protein [Candidatus Methylospira mobilis]|uniref:SbcC/MukB-like Walker B domain-containing protein n=1 Tax=Candidatus Methylospira mobilis TaxID=1808979 RepID=UPI0028EF67A8|nr:SbcC/MukB-like Walker B domain-containing protein [Candidatus Methylospira mobilis]WNV03148.1 SbcC/MukB-like Walker B domain-containing protein [Candidatus Methylospira mobilis]
MKRLVRLLLVNWYRLDCVSVEIDGHTAFIGPNASGKSSLLDAIQTVLVGGDKRQLSLNASAGEKSTRSIRDYCLGVVRDPQTPDLSLAFRPREQALTYLVLCFRDEDSLAETSVGLAMHASLDQPQEHIDGRFIAPGLSLQLDDLIERTSGGSMPKPWKSLREMLYQRCPEVKVVPQSGEFVRLLCASLSDGRYHLDSDRFLRSFRNAITFAPIRNVSDFVRQFVLEERPIQVRQLQQALKHYRDIRDKTEEAKKRESLLDEANQRYTRADQAERRVLSYRWAEQEARFSSVDAEMEPVREQLDALRDLEDRTARELEDAKAALETLRNERMEARARLESSSTAQSKARIAAERRLAQQTMNGVLQKLIDSRHALAVVRRVLDDGDLLPESITPVLQELAALSADDQELLAALWPEQPEMIMAAARQLRPLLGEAQTRLRDQLYALAGRDQALEKELVTLRERINRLESGGSDLSGATRALTDLLAARGIDAVPLCDRIDVGDERWRDAVERFLGGQREALLVAPEQVREAIRIYRQEGRHRNIHGSRIINTLKSAEGRDRIDAESLAEVTVSDDLHAQAYIRRLLGNVRRVEAEDELTRHERAITPDGMLTANGAVSRTQPVEPMLGRDARTRTLTALQQLFQRQAEEWGQSRAEKERLETFLQNTFDPFLRNLEQLPDLCALSEERLQLEGKLDALGEEDARLDTEDYQRLNAEAERLAALCKQHEAGLDAIQKRVTLHAVDKATQQQKLHDLEAEAGRIAQTRREVEQTPGLDREDAARRLEELEKLPEDDSGDAQRWQALAQEAAACAARAAHEMQRLRQESRDTLREYFTHWPAEKAAAFFQQPDGNHHSMAAWTLRTLGEIRETRLAEYEQQAKTALREAEHAFRADFMGRLKDNLARLDDQLAELRRNLRSRPFHGQFYSFIKKPDPDFEPIIRWVETWTPEMAGDVGGLFDFAADPNHPHSAAMQRIQNLLMEAGEGGLLDTRLSDYRYYFGFDVKMTDADGGNAEFLSRRLGKGSGGEHQSPFYVSIGAALAAAYRLRRDENGTLHGGMALAVFDEAFSKLDVQNTVSALGFLDELGLQVILAAPDEKYGLMSEHVDTIVNVYRGGGAVYIDADYLKPEAKALLAGDNPLKSPVSD